MNNCPSCGSMLIMKIIESEAGSLFECIKCNHRFHPIGFRADNILIEGQTKLAF
jgi:Zn ribbon nucleic-acid-binding protein